MLLLFHLMTISERLDFFLRFKGSTFQSPDMPPNMGFLFSLKAQLKG